MKPTPPSSTSVPLDQEALLRGDPAAFEQLVREESPRLFRVIVRILRDEDEAQSVMQETYLQAYRRLATFRGESKFTTWLYAIGINLARGALRKRKRFTEVEDDALERLQPTFSKGMYTESFESWNPQRVTELAERKQLVHDAINKLPDDYRTVVILRDIEELSTAEAAEILGISEGAARVRLHRARQALRKILDAYFKERP